jgi:hypothetical protein
MVFFYLPVERGFIWTVVEDLQELRPPEVEHELRVEGEVVRQTETVWIVLRIFAKFLTLK